MLTNSLCAAKMDDACSLPTTQLALDISYNAHDLSADPFYMPLFASTWPRFCMSSSASFGKLPLAQ